VNGSIAAIVLVPAAIAFGLMPLLVWLWGRRLPSRHETRRTVRVAATREAVFALLTDVRAIPKWRKWVGRVDRLASEPRVRYREYGPQGTLELEIEEATAPSKLVLRTAPRRRMVFEGTWTYELEVDDDGCRVTLTERGEVRSAMARVFAIYVLGHATHVERTLAALVSHFARGGVRTGTPSPTRS
jgi:uncharacterized protein YndB with AHSA1/START domain